METHSNAAGRNRRNKTEQIKKLEDTLRKIIDGSPKKMSLTLDVLIRLCWETENGKREINRALRSYAVGNKGDSQSFLKSISRRKFGCNRAESVDFARYDHFLSCMLCDLSEYLIKHPKSPYRVVVADSLPDMFTAVLPEERDAIAQKTALLLYERSRRNKVKKVEAVQSTHKEDVTSEGIIETSSQQDIPKIQTPTMALRVGPPPMVPENQEKVQVPKIVFRPEPIMAPVQEAPELADNPRQFDLSGFLEKENQARLAANRALDPVLPQEAVETSGTETNGEVVKKPTKLNLSGNNYKDESTTQGEMGYMQRSWLHDPQTPPDQNC